MIFRTLAAISTLYVWGNPTLDGFRPQELDVPASAVREVFKPVVKKVSDYLVQYMPPEVKYAHAKNPLAPLNVALTERRDPE